MDKRRYLVLDCNYLCHRAKHIYGELSDKGSATGVVYGFLKDILTLRERFDTNRFIFCWDYGESLREKAYLPYKQNRTKKIYEENEQEFEDAFQLQVNQLREIYLHTIGFRNIFFQEGYEGDDVMAVTCQIITPDLEQGIIVTADQDLYQQIRKNISCYNPRSKELMTIGRFKNIYGISPRKWAKVKAIAGCTSDNVKGIEGVGVKKAIQYLRGELKETTKAYNNIKSGWRSVVLRNRPLVELPYKGTKQTRFVDDKVTQIGWDKVCKILGMKSIRYRNIL